MIIVTGGAGFIGSNIVKALNDKGITDILVVDNLKDGTKFVNLVDLNIADYMDKEDFLIQIMAGGGGGGVEGGFYWRRVRRCRSDFPRRRVLFHHRVGRQVYDG